MSVSGETAYLRDPGPQDIARAVMWAQAKQDGADIWTLLSDKQREMIEARIAWVEQSGRNEQT